MPDNAHAEMCVASSLMGLGGRSRRTGAGVPLHSAQPAVPCRQSPLAPLGHSSTPPAGGRRFHDWGYTTVLAGTRKERSALESDELNDQSGLRARPCSPLGQSGIEVFVPEAGQVTASTPGEQRSDLQLRLIRPLASDGDRPLHSLPFPALVLLA